MKEHELKQFIGIPVEAYLNDSKMILRGVFKEITDDGHVRLSSVEDVFVLVHGKRLSFKLMLSGSFSDLEYLVKNVSYPCAIVDKCRAIKRSEMVS